MATFPRLKIMNKEGSNEALIPSMHVMIRSGHQIPFQTRSTFMKALGGVNTVPDEIK